MLKKFQRPAAWLFAFCLFAELLSGNGLLSYASSDMEEELEQAEQHISEYERQVQEAEDLLESLNSEQEDLTTTLAQLSAAIADRQSEVDELYEERKEVEAEIDDTNGKLSEVQEDALSQYENMKLRIQYMYEAGTDDFITLLFSSETLADLLASAEYIADISEYDREMLEVYSDTLDEISRTEQTLETQKEELEELIAQSEAAQAGLDILASGFQEQLGEILSSIGETEDEIARAQSDLIKEEDLAAYLEAEIERQAEEALKQAQMLAEQAARERAESEAAESSMEAARKASEATERAVQETEANKTAEEQTEAASSEQQMTIAVAEETTQTQAASEAVLVLTWPLPCSSTITSTFGPRPDLPVEGVSSYHNAIDIAAPEGSDIVAAADGVVYYVGDGTSMGTTAGGNQVWLSHEGGRVMTTYMHCSKLYVTEGQTVTAGQVIAAVGSTGLSTGNHLDFRIMLDGQYIDPLGSLVTYR